MAAWPKSASTSPARRAGAVSVGRFSPSSSALSEEAGLWTLQAGIFPENAASIVDPPGLRIPHRRRAREARKARRRPGATWRCSSGAARASRHRALRVLVVGGTGFVGGAVVRSLLEDGHEVAAFHRGESRAARRRSAGTGRISRRTARPFGASRPRSCSTRSPTRKSTAALSSTRSAASRGGSSSFRARTCTRRTAGSCVWRAGRPSAPPRRRTRPCARAAIRTARMAKPGDMAYDYEKILVESAVRDEAGRSGDDPAASQWSTAPAIRSGGSGLT